MSLRAKFPPTPILCYVTDRKTLGSNATAETPAGLKERISAAAAAGVDCIQIREQDLSGKDVALLVRDAVALAKSVPQQERSTRILVNDRLDVALAERAGGVHLGEESLPIGKVSQWLRSSAHQSTVQDFLVGVSCHSIERAVAAERDGADYIFFGPIFNTPSKAAFGAPQGLERLKEVCAAVTLPVLAIGGITIANASACREAGAAGIAAIRLFQDATDVAALIRKLRAEFSFLI